MAEKGFVIPTQEAFDQFSDAVRWTRNFKATGPGVSVVATPTGVTLTIDAPRRQAAQQRRTDVTVKAGEPYAGGGKYAGKILFPPSGTLAKTGTLTAADLGDATGATPCVIYSAREQGKDSHVLRDGEIYNGRLIGFFKEEGEDDLPVVLVDAGPLGLFRVTLAQTSGSAGDATTPPSWVYNVSYGDTSNVATGKSPEVGRSNGYFEAATIGIGYVDDAGAWQLLQAFEPPGTVPCATDEGEEE
jgi:hypothetical protein